MDQQAPLLLTLVSSLVKKAPNDGIQEIVNKVLKGEHNPEADLPRGLIAGAVAGLAGAVAKTVTERFFPIKASDPSDKKAIAIGDSELVVDIDTGAIVTGVLIGGAYGAAAELAPEVTGGNGLGLGSAVYGINNAGDIMDHNKVELKPNEENEAHELLSDLVYGLVVEYVREAVRARLN